MVNTLTETLSQSADVCSIAQMSKADLLLGRLGLDSLVTLVNDVPREVSGLMRERGLRKPQQRAQALVNDRL